MVDPSKAPFIVHNEPTCASPFQVVNVRELQLPDRCLGFPSAPSVKGSCIINLSTSVFPPKTVGIYRHPPSSQSIQLPLHQQSQLPPAPVALLVRRVHHHHPIAHGGTMFLIEFIFTQHWLLAGLPGIPCLILSVTLILS
jgi:hypothetical protein